MQKLWNGRINCVIIRSSSSSSSSSSSGGVGGCSSSDTDNNNQKRKKNSSNFSYETRKSQCFFMQETCSMVTVFFINVQKPGRLFLFLFLWTPLIYNVIKKF